MSKQYLTVKVLAHSHPSDIFSLTCTPSYIISGSGSSSILVNGTLNSEFQLCQVITEAHPLGCHHVVASKNGNTVASAGFGGEVKIWELVDSPGNSSVQEGKNASARVWKELQSEIALEKSPNVEVWAIALSSDEQRLAATSPTGRVWLWSLRGERPGSKLYEFDTQGSFGLCVDMSTDGRFTASGHENGGIYIFNNETGLMVHSLPGLIYSVRAVSFSPGGKLLAAAGDSNIIALYDVVSGEQVANLTGHQAWILSLDWNMTGEWLLSGAFDGKAKVWSTATRSCVATISSGVDNDDDDPVQPIWSVRWIPRQTNIDAEMFAIAGKGGSIAIFREGGAKC